MRSQILIFPTQTILAALAFLFVASIFTSSAHAVQLGSNENPIAFGDDQTIVDLEKVVWKPLEVEGLPPGAEIATLRGDLDRAGSQSVVRIPPGYVVPTHTHTSNELYVWIKGAFTLVSDDGRKEQFNGPAFISLPGNAKPNHGLICGDEEPCIFYLSYLRPFDIKYDR